MIPDNYDNIVFEIVFNSHWIYIDNQNIGSQMCDETGYDNAVNYGMIYYGIISKLNVVTDKDNINQHGDKTTREQNVWDLPVT